jgi:uncharacterized protein YyaL (SSP411 family)
LFAAREQRPKPFRDEKILTAWNGLMLSGMIQAYTVLGGEETRQAITETIAFLQQHMLHDTMLFSVYKDGQAKLNGYLDDYAFFAAALLDAFEAFGERAYFDLACTLTTTMLEEFWDEEQGAFFFTGKQHEKLLSRIKTPMDQAMPSGTAVAAKTLLRLYHYTGREDYLQRAERVLRIFKRHMEQQPLGFGSMLAALDFYLVKPKEIVVIGSPGSADMQALLRTVQQHYLPNKVLIQIDAQHATETLAALPLLRDVLAGKTQVDGKATAYVCHNFTCSLPVTEADALAALLRQP